MAEKHHFNLKSADQSFSLANGFLPETDPITSLPKELNAYEQIAKQLPKLLSNTTIRPLIDALPTFDITVLDTFAQYERAMMILSFIAHAYVWADGTNPATSLPKNLSMAWYAVAKKLGRPPVLSYASYALYNWYRLDPSKPIELGNIALLQNFLGGADEEWFILIHIVIEANAIPALQALMPLQLAAQQQDVKQMIYYLQIIKDSLQHICETMARMPEHCDPYIYYHRVRPYIHGWQANPALPDGLIYPGIEEFNEQPVKFKGETGAQSSIIPCLDAVLGIDHEDSPLKHHLRQMRTYMPPQHLTFLESLEQQPSIRDSVIQLKNSNLTQAYNDCLKLIYKFRTIHYEYAAQYIHKQAQIDAANSNEVGTGGTPFMQYLKEHQQETEARLV